MRLTNKLVTATLQGRKTQHRIPRGTTGRAQYRPGRIYPVQKPDGTPVGTFAVIKRTQGLLGDVDSTMARLEGHKSPEKFLEAWTELYGDPDPGRLVWVLHIQVAEQPRLLTPAARPAHSELGYTDRTDVAMRQEPEAVDHTAQETITARAEMTTAQWQELRCAREEHQRRGLPLHERVKLAVTDARTSSVDVRSSLRAIERQVERVERQLRRDEKAA